MLNALIGFSLKNRFVVLLLAAILIYLGVTSALKLPLDAFPDTTPNQVQINTVASELSPEEIERQVTYPVELALGGLKGLLEIRSVSKFGLSQVVAIFDDSVDIYFARQQINERLGEVKLPPGIDRPAMGPVATGLGEVYHYYLTSPCAQPGRAARNARLGRAPAAVASAWNRRDQHAGRRGQAVRGAGRSGQAGQVHAVARRRDRPRSRRTTRTSAVDPSTRRAR